MTVMVRNTQTKMVMTYDEAWHEFFTKYDGDDDTSCVGFWDIYEEV